MPAFSSNFNSVNQSTSSYYKNIINFTINCFYVKIQYAAGCFKHLDEVIIPEMRIAPPLDMSSETLNVLTSAMLAQAQECFWQKAVHGE